jgi:hypothetical protein
MVDSMTILQLVRKARVLTYYERSAVVVSLCAPADKVSLCYGGHRNSLVASAKFVRSLLAEAFNLAQISTAVDQVLVARANE